MQAELDTFKKAQGQKSQADAMLESVKESLKQQLVAKTEEAENLLKEKEQQAKELETLQEKLLAEQQEVKS